MAPKVSRSGCLAVSKAAHLSVEERRELHGLLPPAINNGLPAAAAVPPLLSPRPPLRRFGVHSPRVSGAQALAISGADVAKQIICCTSLR